MIYLNIFIFLFVSFQMFIARFLKDVIVNFCPSLGALFIHPSISEAMRQIVMQPGWQNWPYVHIPDVFNIFAVFQMLALMMIPALILCGPLFIISSFYKNRSLYFVPVIVGIGTLLYFSLLNEFNPDPQGALILIFGPIYALIPTAIAAAFTIIADRFISKQRRQG